MKNGLLFIVCVCCLYCSGCGDTSVNSESSAVANPDITSGSEAILTIPQEPCNNCSEDALEVALYMLEMVNDAAEGDYTQAGYQPPSIEVLTEIYVEGTQSLEDGEEPISVQADFDDNLDDLLDNSETNDLAETEETPIT